MRKQEKALLDNCLTDLINQLEVFDLQTCKIHIEYRIYYNDNEESRSILVRIRDINDGPLAIGMIEPIIFDFETERGVPAKVSSLLIESDFKFTELRKLTLFLWEFQKSHETKRNFPQAPMTWWESFKYNYLTTRPHHTYKIENYKYTKKESNAR